MTRKPDLPRELADHERMLIKWLLAEADPRGKKFLEQMDSVWVVGTCDCGCPSLDLAVRGESRPPEGPHEIAADVYGLSPEGFQVDVILHAAGGALRLLEVYAPAGDGPPSLPRPEGLVAWDYDTIWSN